MARRTAWDEDQTRPPWIAVLNGSFVGAQSVHAMSLPLAASGHRLFCVVALKNLGTRRT